MFHWICPECGREIPPAVKECPACDPKARLAPVEVAPPPQKKPELPVEPAPDPLLAMAEMIRSAQAAVARQETRPEPIPPAEPKIEPPGEPAVEPEVVTQSVADLAAAVGVVEPVVEPVPEPVVEPVAEPVAVAVAAPAAEPVAAAPQISITQFFPKTEAVALLAAPEVETVAPAGLAAAAEMALAPARVTPPPEPSAQPVPHPALPPITQLASEERPPSGSWLPMAPLQDYIEVAEQSMRPARPAKTLFGADSEPKVTLAGPALPPDLVSLKNAGIVTVIGGPKAPRKIPGWLVSGMLMLGIPLVGGLLLMYFQPERSNAEAKAPAAAAVTPTIATTPAPAAHSLADYVEVTGFRFLVDFNKKSEIHYLVVNHSGAELSDMTVYVTLRAADAKAGQPPLCRFSFRAPGLAPFESKEMTSPIEKLTRSVVLPEWQNLHADVQVGQ